MDIQPETSKDVLTYTLYVAGVFGRNRKAKNGMFKIAETEAGKQLTDAEIQELVNKELATQKVKPGAKYRVVEQGETVNTREIDGRIYTSRSFMIFTGLKRLEGVVS